MLVLSQQAFVEAWIEPEPHVEGNAEPQNVQAAAASANGVACGLYGKSWLGDKTLSALAFAAARGLKHKHRPN